VKANLSHMKALPLSELRPSTEFEAPVYLFLPRNHRMVLLRKAGEKLGEELYQTLLEKRVLELWRPPQEELISIGSESAAEATPEFALLLEERPDLFDPSSEAALRIREAVQIQCADAAREDAFLAEILEFRQTSTPDAHSVLVGNLASALALAEGHPEALADLLIAATFHDLAFTLLPGEHGRAAVSLFAESELALPAAALEAIERHHEPGPHPAGTPLRYLSLAERFAELRAAAPDLPIRDLFEKFAHELPPSDAALFGGKR